MTKLQLGHALTFEALLHDLSLRHDYGMRLATPNDDKLSDARGWRGRAVVTRRKLEAAAVTAERVR